MNRAIRSVAPASTTIPITDESRSAWNSPWPASSTASDPTAMAVAAMPPAQNRIVRPSVSGSIDIAPATTALSVSHCHTARPMAAPSATTVRPGTTLVRTTRLRNNPAMRTMTAPAASAMTGEIAAKSMCGPWTLFMGEQHHVVAGRRLLARLERRLRVEAEREDRHDERDEHEPIAPREVGRVLDDLRSAPVVE